MKHLTSRALGPLAPQTCAKSAEHSFPGMGSISLQPAFQPVSRRDIMAAINICSRDLGLRQGALVTLDALLSCLPCQTQDRRETTVTPTTLLTIYASNETLCFRAKGLTDRQLRRHLQTLETAGLISRRDSANGKRFPVMRQGKAIGAFGLDLSPLFARSAELTALARRRREEAEELRGLRAQILRLRVACLDVKTDDTATGFIEGVKNLVRRASLTLCEARAALARLTTVLAGASQRPTANHEDSAEGPSQKQVVGLGIAAETHQMSGSDGQNVRHKEPKSETKKTKRPSEQARCWEDLSELNAFYARPDSDREATRIAFEFGRMLRISQDILVSAANRVGFWGLLRIEDDMAKQASTILNPDAYLRSILRV